MESPEDYIAEHFGKGDQFTIVMPDRSERLVEVVESFRSGRVTIQFAENEEWYREQVAEHRRRFG